MIKKFLLFFLLLPSIAFAAVSDATCFGDSNASLMLHMDGSDASTTFTDDTAGPKTVSATNNAQIDTAQSKFGGASALFDGTNDYVTSADSGDWHFGTGDFTIDLWVRFNGDPSGGGEVNFVSQWDGPPSNTNSAWLFDYAGATDTLRFGYNSGGVTVKSVSWNPATATWYHVAVSRSGNDLKFFVDGTQVGATQDVTGVDLPNVTYEVDAGARVDVAGPTVEADMNGWIDELRITKGKALYTANFTPQTIAYFECENKVY